MFPRSVWETLANLWVQEKRRHSPYAHQVHHKPLTTYGKPALRRKPQWLLDKIAVTATIFARFAISRGYFELRLSK